jgi:hypothetical protein
MILDGAAGAEVRRAAAQARRPVPDDIHSANLVLVKGEPDD